MKTKHQTPIVATKRINLGHMPVFVQFGHQGLTKSQPTPIASTGDVKTYLIPKDILQMSVSDPALYENIESIEFTYQKTKP